MEDDSGDKLTPDALPDHWVARAPAAAQPFLRLMRLDRPIGAWLLAIPCYWGSSLAALAEQRPIPHLWHLVLFTIGAIVMRGAGCVWNDLIDQDIDAKVARTRSRPLAAGLVSRREAILFMIGLALAGLVILLQFNAFTVRLGILSLILIALYPFMKRVSDFPQVVLGLAFSWGALMGWGAVFGTLGVPALMLYASCILWTIGYDTIYALQDIDDDALIGVRSTARFFGDRAKSFIVGCYALCLLTAGGALLLVNAGVISFIGLLLFAILLGFQILRLEPGNPASALAAFRANKLAGLLLFAAMVADSLVRYGWLNAAR